MICIWLCSCIMLSLIGCGQNSAGKTDSKISSQTVGENQIKKTLVDGITYIVPKTWEENEYKNSNKTGSDIGFGYYLETDGDVKESRTEWIGYDTTNVVEGVELFVAETAQYQGMSADEVYNSLKQYLDEESYPYEETIVGKAKGISSEESDKVKITMVPLGGKYYFGYRIISDKSKLTRHTDEVNEFINSISIDMSAFKEKSVSNADSNRDTDDSKNESVVSDEVNKNDQASSEASLSVIEKSSYKIVDGTTIGYALLNDASGENILLMNVDTDDLATGNTAYVMALASALGNTKMDKLLVYVKLNGTEMLTIGYNYATKQDEYVHGREIDGTEIDDYPSWIGDDKYMSNDILTIGMKASKSYEQFIQEIGF